jgi:uncharacterized membrane protein
MKKQRLQLINDVISIIAIIVALYIYTVKFPKMESYVSISFYGALMANAIGIFVRDFLYRTIAIVLILVVMIISYIIF